LYIQWRSFLAETEFVGIVISSSVRAKLAGKTPPVSESEIIQCFANRTRSFLIDTRADNMTNPLTRWFIAETDFGRKLKVAFMPTADGIVIKTAYDPNAEELRIYNKVAEPI
jgi:hypothetical protein